MIEQADEELLQWVIHILEHEQRNGTHGEIRIQLKAGRVMSAKVEACHLPPTPERPPRAVLCRE